MIPAAFRGAASGIPEETPGDAQFYAVRMPMYDVILPAAAPSRR